MIETNSSNPFSNINVLLIDDDAKLASLERDILSTFGFSRISICKDGEEAIALMASQDFDLIMSDWEMRPMRGIDFVKFVRHDIHSPNPFVPIIMVTGRAEIYDVMEARDAGVTEFIAKPFTVEDLRKRLIEVIEHPRPFVMSDSYKGPDRRRREGAPPDGVERRKDRKPS